MKCQADFYIKNVLSDFSLSPNAFAGMCVSPVNDAGPTSTFLRTDLPSAFIVTGRNWLMTALQKNGLKSVTIYRLIDTIRQTTTMLVNATWNK